MANHTTPTTNDQPAQPKRQLHTRAELQVVRNGFTVSFRPGMIDADKLTPEEIEHFTKQGVLVSSEHLLAAAIGR